MHSPQFFVPQSLDSDTLACMRAPPDADELDPSESEEDDSSDDDDDEEEEGEEQDAEEERGEEEEKASDGRRKRMPGSFRERGPSVVGCSSSSAGEIIY